MSDAHGPRRRTALTPQHAEAYAGLLDRMRALQDAVVAPDCDPETLCEVASALDALSERLGPPAAPDADWRHMLDPMPSRGRPMCPPVTITARTPETVTATVVFGHFFLGRNGAAHGGAVAMCFDELFGSLINRIDGFRARTASLRIDYKRITPISCTLRAEAAITRHEGRKYTICGHLADDEGLCATAEGLFIVLNPGQP